MLSLSIISAFPAKLPTLQFAVLVAGGDRLPLCAEGIAPALLAHL